MELGASIYRPIQIKKFISCVLVTQMIIYVNYLPNIWGCMGTTQYLYTYTLQQYMQTKLCVYGGEV